MLNLQVTPELYVDTARGQKLRINVDALFPKLPCVCKYRFILSHNFEVTFFFFSLVAL